jgi:hypothetical protein
MGFGKQLAEIHEKAILGNGYKLAQCVWQGLASQVLALDY